MATSGAMYYTRQKVRTLLHNRCERKNSNVPEAILCHSWVWNYRPRLAHLGWSLLLAPGRRAIHVLECISVHAVTAGRPSLSTYLHIIAYVEPDVIFWKFSCVRMYFDSCCDHWPVGRWVLTSDGWMEEPGHFQDELECNLFRVIAVYRRILTVLCLCK